MTDADRLAFAEMMAAVHTYYGKPLPDSVLAIYWEGLKPYDLAAIRQALGLHAKNPDTGQFLPKIADVEKMLGGTTLDSALVALNKVERAMSSAGVWRSVAFDDPIIHAVVVEMGGWVEVCQSKSWDFRRTEFLNRYRSHRLRSQVPVYPARLIGICEGSNETRGAKTGAEDMVLIGDPAAARRVISGGSDVARIGVTQMGKLSTEVVKQLEAKNG